MFKKFFKKSKKKSILFRPVSKTVIIIVIIVLVLAGLQVSFIIYQRYQKAYGWSIKNFILYDANLTMQNNTNRIIDLRSELNKLKERVNKLEGRKKLLNQKRTFLF